jgi:hypothetical protein
VDFLGALLYEGPAIPYNAFRKELP